MYLNFPNHPGQHTCEEAMLVTRGCLGIFHTIILYCCHLFLRNILELSVGTNCHLDLAVSIFLNSYKPFT